MHSSHHTPCVPRDTVPVTCQQGLGDSHTPARPNHQPSHQVAFGRSCRCDHQKTFEFLVREFVYDVDDDDAYRFGLNDGGPNPCCCGYSCVVAGW